MALLLLLLFGISPLAFAAAPQSAIVVVPVADVWSRPLAPGEKPSDDLRETQVLSGEKVIVHESSGPWTLIEAVEQPEFTHHNRWEGYPGWVRSDFIQTSMSTRRPNPLNIPILQTAQNALGTPYLWGGLSMNGFDCSGLVHLSYRYNKKEIPRDAHDQWLKAKPIKRTELKPADLIFSAKAEKPKNITHVALYAGEGQLFEAPQTGMVVRRISFKDKFGKDFEKVESGDKVGDRIVYFGSFLH